MAEQTQYVVPTVTLDFNEANVLAMVTRAWLENNKSEMTATHLENWNALISKLRGF
jgi:hypothetical protein